ncbi:hypothetical protein LTR92_006630 [Exophiala xenobiotica]|nr:hypothetical protein LTR92_006630 [Exophiala xenobiotica]
MSMLLAGIYVLTLIGTLVDWQALSSNMVPVYHGNISATVEGVLAAAIELGGPELQIANAANKAGFDTFNHEALFDLIWAAKQAAMTPRANRPGPASIPQGPLYPDRYRPKGSANYLKRGKPRTKKPPPNHNVELKFHPIKPLMRKRPHQNEKEEILIDLTISSDDLSPAELPSLPDNAVKRRKTSGAGGGIEEPGSGSARFSSNQVSKGFPNKAQAAIKPVSKRTASQQTTLFAPQTTRPTPLTAEAEIAKQLLLVKTKLDDARKSMNTCQSTMKALFDTHYNAFDNDQMMMGLQKLSNFMNKVFDGSRDGAAEVDSAIVLLGKRKDGRA